MLHMNHFVLLLLLLTRILFYIFTQELQELSGRDMLHMTSQTLQKLLPVLNECTEWGQVCWFYFNQSCEIGVAMKLLPVLNECTEWGQVRCFVSVLLHA